MQYRESNPCRKNSQRPLGYGCLSGRASHLQRFDMTLGVPGRVHARKLQHQTNKSLATHDTRCKFWKCEIHYATIICVRFLTELSFSYGAIRHNFNQKIPLYTTDTTIQPARLL